MAAFLECFDITQSATITVYAQQPDPGDDDAWVTSWGGGAFVGHTFISISQNGNTSVFGFYPSTDDTTPQSPPEDSAIGEDSGHTFNVSISVTVPGNVLNSILQYAINYEGTYDLDNYNCTDFGLGIGNLAGLNLPDCYGSWPFGGGSNPGALGEYIRGMSTPGGSINSMGGTAPISHKGC